MLPAELLLKIFFVYLKLSDPQNENVQVHIDFYLITFWEESYISIAFPDISNRDI